MYFFNSLYDSFDRSLSLPSRLCINSGLSNIEIVFARIRRFCFSSTFISLTTNFVRNTPDIAMSIRIITPNPTFVDTFVVVFINKIDLQLDGTFLYSYIWYCSVRFSSIPLTYFETSRDKNENRNMFDIITIDIMSQVKLKFPIIVVAYCYIVGPTPLLYF